MKTNPIKTILRFFIALAFSVFAPILKAVPDISGSWKVTEKVTLKLSAQGESDTIKQQGTMNVNMHQSGSSVYYYRSFADPTSGKTRLLRRNGKISGNKITFTGIAVVPVNGIKASKNSMIAVLTISKDVRLIKGNSTVDARLSGNGLSGTITGGGTVVMVSNRPAPEIVVEQPGKSDLVDEKSTVGFGTVTTGQSSMEKEFVIRNAGKANLTGISIKRSGNDLLDFIVTNAPKTTLAPGKSTSFTIKFRPSGQGTHVATIHISNNDPDENPFGIKLTGMGAK